MPEISLAKYAEKHGKAMSTVRQLIQRGGLKTARKAGRNWVIDSEEPYPDNRRKDVGQFSMRHGMYVVDEIAAPVGSLETMYVRIGDDWYRKAKSLIGVSPSNPAPIWVPDPFRNGTEKYEESWLTAVDVYGCLPSDTDFIRRDLDRAATKQELADLVDRYKATKIGERDMPLGRHWGEEYVVTIREAVYEMTDDNAAKAERILGAKGVYVDHDRPRSLTVRIG